MEEEKKEVNEAPNEEQKPEVIDAEATPVTGKKKKLTRKQKRHMDLPGNPLKGRKLYKASNFFFALSCIMTAIVGATFAVPFFTIIFGIMSVMIWFVFVAFGTIFTIGLMWTVQGIKDANASWMDFNSKVFDSGAIVANALITAIPILAGVGLAIFILTWILLGVGYKKDEFRRKGYKAKLIIFIFITLLFIVLSIVSMFAKFGTQ